MWSKIIINGRYLELIHTARLFTILVVPAILLAVALIANKPRSSAQAPALQEKIVFHSQRDGNREIYVMNADGSDQTRLTTDPGEDMEPWLSSDGTKIVFQSDRDGNFDIYIMNVDGTNPVNLTDDLNFNTQPTMSPDGTKIAFNSNSSIFVMDVQGSNRQNLTTAFPNVNADPAFNHDGSKIAFRSNREDDDLEIYVMDSDGTDPERLTTNLGVIDEQPTFSPDGTRIVFNTQQDATSEIWVMDGDGNNPVRLTNNAFLERHPSFSPDGTRIAFTSARDGNNEIYVMNEDGSNPTRLTNATGSDFGAMWGLVPLSPTPTVEDQIDLALTTIRNAGLARGTQASLNSKLQAALDAHQNGDDAAACAELRSFVNYVSAQSGKKISANLATELTNTTSDIGVQLGCS